MSKPAIIDPDKSYNFTDFFKLNFAPQDILAYFGISLYRDYLDLPHFNDHLDRLSDLHTPYHSHQ